MKWILHMLGFSQPEVEVPINVFTRNELSVHVYERHPACGHTGHLVELMRYFDQPDEWLSAGLVMDIDLADFVLLAQEAQEYLETISPEVMRCATK